MAFALALFLSFGPAFLYAAILYWLDRFEKEPRKMLLGCFLWGAVVATTGAIIWSSFFEIGLYIAFQNEGLVELSGATMIAPVVEETLKGLAVLIVFLAFRHEFDSILDGIVYAGITALGFAATENVLYLFFGGYSEDGFMGLFVLFFLRVILGGWGHAVYTAFIGIGFAVARLSHSLLLKIIAPLSGLGIAIALHALHNTMASLLIASAGFTGLAATLLVDWMGWLVVLGLIIWAIMRERRWIATYLQEEVERGTITAQQYQAACSVGARFVRPIPATGGHPRTTRRFFQLCAELAQKKHQFHKLGEQQQAAATIEQLRSELAQLMPLV